MQVTPEEVAMLLGQKDVEIFCLRKEIAALRAELQKLQPQPEDKQA